MRKKSEDQGDLFEWAKTRPTAVVIDVVDFFERRLDAFIDLLCAGYRPPRRDAEIIDFAVCRKQARRKAKPKAGKKAAAGMRDAS